MKMIRKSDPLPVGSAPTFFGVHGDPIWDFTIPAVPPSLNVLLRSHWSVRKRAANDWHDYVWVSMRKMPVLGKPMVERAIVLLDFRCRKDGDNMAKLVVDALVTNRIIAGDSAKHLAALILRSELAGKQKPATRVRVWSA